MARRCLLAPALRRGFVLQSCLCPTPDFRSFHMGIALSALTLLPSPLRALSRWLQQDQRLEAEPDTRPHPASTHSGSQNALPSGQRPHATAPERENRSPAPTSVRPLRGSWPFNVRPAPAPAQPADRPHHPYSSSANRSFFPASSSRGSRDAFLASLVVDPCARSAPRVLRRTTDDSTGKLVITGRMADVCAELERLAALEALQVR